MEVRLKQATLLLLLTVAGAVLAGEFIIKLDKVETQSQKVSPGSFLTLRCCLKTEKFERYWVYWFFEPSGSNKSVLLFEKMTGNTTQQPSQHLESECHDKAFSISNVNETHSGWYFCKVRFEIPTLHFDTSNKTEVVVLKLLVENTTFLSLVTSTKVNATTSSWRIWIVSGLSSVIVLILIVALVLYAARKRNFPGSRVVEPVYENTRKRRSSQPKLEVDTLKAGSCSQNPRTPSPSGRYERQLRYHV